ncbi:substrate-binding domain-containing protein [Dongshaea marina]|uniref:substrate-binding domain-containing protein n=1 Tax=Dongshaea marina TaxID=2047966 RepID=UPI000D3ED657|nr:substrate-binding domain-containing protein [Dongshaea marina]
MLSPTPEFVHNNSSALRWLLLICLPLLVLLLSSCDQKRDKPDEIHLILSTLDNPFFLSMRDGAIEEARRQGIILKVYGSANSLEKERHLVYSSVDNLASVILLNPTDSEGSSKSLDIANRADIPVITLDRSVGSGRVKSHVSSDNLAGGRMVGEYLNARLKGLSNKVGMLIGIPESSAAQQRGKGFELFIKASPLQLVGTAVGDFDRHKGEVSWLRPWPSSPRKWGRSEYSWPSICLKVSGLSLMWLRR